jgi:hypothetical protein
MVIPGMIIKEVEPIYYLNEKGRKTKDFTGEIHIYLDGTGIPDNIDTNNARVYLLNDFGISYTPKQLENGEVIIEDLIVYTTNVHSDEKGVYLVITDI